MRVHVRNGENNFRNFCNLCNFYNFSNQSLKPPQMPIMLKPTFYFHEEKNSRTFASKSASAQLFRYMGIEKFLHELTAKWRLKAE